MAHYGAQGKRGAEHDVAVALGLKEEISGDDPRAWSRSNDADPERRNPDAQ